MPLLRILKSILAGFLQSRAEQGLGAGGFSGGDASRQGCGVLHGAAPYSGHLGSIH